MNDALARSSMTATLPLEVVDLRKSFPQGEERLEVLRGIDFSLAAGEIVALVGPSGAGKSTLLQIIGLLEQADSGTLRLSGHDAFGLDDGARTRLRRDYLGFVYQFHHLLPEFSALENLTLPSMLAGEGKSEALQRADDLLARVGLAERRTHRPAQLSGGEQQRVAIARALVNSPTVLLADEPTGNLDPETADGVFNYLLSVVRETQTAALIATHNPELARRMDRILRLEDGHVVEQG